MWGPSVWSYFGPVAFCPLLSLLSFGSAVVVMWRGGFSWSCGPLFFLLPFTNHGFQARQRSVSRLLPPLKCSFPVLPSCVVFLMASDSGFFYPRYLIEWRVLIILGGLYRVRRGFRFPLFSFFLSAPRRQGLCHDFCPYSYKNTKQSRICISVSKSRQYRWFRTMRAHCHVVFFFRRPRKKEGGGVWVYLGEKGRWRRSRGNRTREGFRKLK